MPYHNRHAARRDYVSTGREALEAFRTHSNFDFNG